MLDLPILLRVSLAGDVVQRRSDDVEFFVLRLIAPDNTDTGVFHIPFRSKHPDAVVEPVEILGGRHIDAGDIPRPLKMGGKRGPHRTENNGWDIASLLGDLINVGPRLIETHANHDEAVRGAVLELFETGIDGVFIGKRLGFNIELNVELLRGRGQDLRILPLAGGDVVRRTGPAHPVALHVRANEHHADTRLAGRPRFGGNQRRGEIQHTYFRRYRQGPGPG